MDLSGKVALVTGGSSGLGRHFAALLASKGTIVFAAGRREEALADLRSQIESAGGRCYPLVMDVTDAASVERGFAQIAATAEAPLSIVVNNAGVAQTRAAIDVSLEDWQSVLAPNLTGAFLVARAAALPPASPIASAAARRDWPLTPRARQD